MGSSAWLSGISSQSNLEGHVEEEIPADWDWTEHEAMGYRQDSRFYEEFCEGYRRFCHREKNILGQPCYRAHLDMTAWEHLDWHRRVDIATAKKKEADEKADSGN